MAEAQQNTTSSFLIKIDKIRKKSYANSIFLKPDDVIVALNNQLYTFGEKRFVEELKDLKKSNETSLLTILRNEIFIDVIIENSLGCGFITTDSNETEKIKEKFSKKKNYDIEELKDYIAMRDVYRRYDVYENNNSLSAGLFPPLWLAYARKWWVLLAFSILFFMLFSVNFFLFLLGWILTSVYCYKAQLNLLFSFSMLEGKAFSMKFAAKSMDEAHNLIRNLDPKSRFMFSKLGEPENEEVSPENTKKNEENSNIIDEKSEALV
ncbi:MAG: hypothetical protein CMM92_07190 [Rickettsiales bacterium]|nr:hypothetical protein [Rickettsiales bacterium]RPG12399.1 MAG: hypothetical protein CBD55_007130 [Pelagibacteraceae bacterium TMED195]|tara:strand:- start:1760 stop:2554 length:795 start_codon:yes stop_codon:yes gene_type:complete